MLNGKHDLLSCLHPLDERDLLEAIKHSNYKYMVNIKLEFDFVVLPYASRKHDIQHVRDVLGPNG